MHLDENFYHTQHLMTTLSNSLHFHDVSRAKLKRIASISQFRQWQPGQVVYDVGSSSDALYVILSGKAEYKYSPDSGARKLGTKIEEGDIAGWAALLKNRPKRPGRIIAATALEAMVVPANELEDIFRDDPIEWKTIISRFATMVSREYSVPSHISEIQKEIEDLEAGAYEMEKQLLRHKMGRVMPKQRRISVAERFQLIQMELERIACRIEYNPQQLSQAWNEAEARIDQMFKVELPLKNTNNLPNWG